MTKCNDELITLTITHALSMFTPAVQHSAVMAMSHRMPGAEPVSVRLTAGSCTGFTRPDIERRMEECVMRRTRMKYTMEECVYGEYEVRRDAQIGV